MTILKYDEILNICKYLDKHELANFAQVDRKFHAAVQGYYQLNASTSRRQRYLWSAAVITVTVYTSEYFY